PQDIRDGLLREPTRLQKGEQFSETVGGDPVDVEGFASQFAERVEQDGRDQTRLSKLAGDQLEQLVHSLLNKLVRLLFMNRVLACETGVGDVRPFGQMLANAIETFPRHADWRRVRAPACPSGDRQIQAGTIRGLLRLSSKRWQRLWIASLGKRR